MESSNIYIIIIVIAILFLLLDYTITLLHNKVENFNNVETFTPSEGNMAPSLSPSMAINNTAKDKGILELPLSLDLKSVNDFYPKNNDGKPLNELQKFTLENNVFHQILPKFGDGYLGIIWHEPAMYGIYSSNSLIDPNWELMDNSIPEGMLRPVFLSFDKDRKLLVIFEESGTYNLNKYHLYKKEEIDLNSPFKFIGKSAVCSLIFDENDTLIGLDEKGRWYKKKNKNLESDWSRIEIGFTNIPMRRLLFDYRSKYMIGLGQDFRIYKKRSTDWLNGEWDTTNGPSKKTMTGLVRDLWYDYDGILMGLSMVGIVKQQNKYYLSDFKIYEKEVLNKEVSIYKVLYSSTGVNVFGNLSNNNNSNNVYVDGKKISEYKFKDPRLNKYLKHRMEMKKKCRKIKAMRINQEENQKEVEEDIRNDKFMRILDEQKDTIDNLMDTISFLRNKD
jgi:hypothetical protein